MSTKFPHKTGKTGKKKWVLSLIKAGNFRIWKLLRLMKERHRDTEIGVWLGREVQYIRLPALV